MNSTFRDGAVQVDGIPAPDASYAQAVWAGPTLYTSGMRPVEAGTGLIVGDTVREQTSQTLLNLERLLQSCGLGMDNVVRVTVHLADIDRDFVAFDEVYRTFFSPPFPARTTVGSKLGDVLLEVDLIAARDLQR